MILQFVLSTGTGVHGFTLDPSLGEFILTHPDIQVYLFLYSSTSIILTLFCWECTKGHMLSLRLAFFSLCFGASNIQFMSTSLPRFQRKEKSIQWMKGMPKIGMVRRPSMLSSINNFLFLKPSLEMSDPFDFQVCGKVQIPDRWFITKVSKIHWKVSYILNLAVNEFQVFKLFDLVFQSQSEIGGELKVYL